MLRAQDRQQARGARAQDLWLPRFPGISCTGTHTPGVYLHAEVFLDTRSGSYPASSPKTEQRWAWASWAAILPLHPHFSVSPPGPLFLGLSLVMGCSLQHCSLWGCLHVSHDCAMFQDTWE